jgi:hypothetical protein
MTLTAFRWRRGCAGRRGGPGGPPPTPTPALAARRRGLPEECSRPVPPWGHPDFVLAAAARAGILTRAEAALIGRNRLENVPLARIATETGISHTALCNRRAHAERKITAAIQCPRLTAVTSGFRPGTLPTRSAILERSERDSNRRTTTRRLISSQTPCILSRPPNHGSGLEVRQPHSTRRPRGGGDPRVLGPDSRWTVTRAGQPFIRDGS